MTVDQSVIDTIAPKGVLRAAINLANFLLVSGTRVDGTPDGVSPDIARRIAAALDVPCEFVLFEGPGQLADTVDNDVWDIGNIAIEQARAQTIKFSDPYVQIDANFLIRRGAPFTDNESIDMAGVTIAAYRKSAYDLWLSKTLRNATIVRCESIEISHEMFRRGKADVLASLKPKLLDELSSYNGYEIVEPSFTGIQQAVGIAKHRLDNSGSNDTGMPAMDFINALIAEMIKDGDLAASLKFHGVANNLSVPTSSNMRLL